MSLGSVGAALPWGGGGGDPDPQYAAISTSPLPIGHQTPSCLGKRVQNIYNSANGLYVSDRWAAGEAGGGGVRGMGAGV